MSRVEIVRANVGRLNTCPGSTPWLHDLIANAIPSAVAFHLSEAGIGAVPVFVEVQHSTDAGPDTFTRMQDILNRETPAGWRFQLIGLSVRREDAAWFDGGGGFVLRSVKLGDADGQWKGPSADALNEMQNAAVREVAKRDAEIERLGRMLTAEEGAHATDARIAGKRADEAKALRAALDEQTRFLAGLNLQDHPLREQKDRDAQVHRAMELLRPDGARVDNETMNGKVRSKPFGAAVWPDVDYERVSVAPPIPGDGPIRAGVRAMTTVVIDGTSHPYALQMVCDVNDAKAFNDACSQLRTRLEERVGFRF